MKTIVAILFGTCALGLASAFDASCNAKIQAFKDCHVQARAQLQQDAQAKLQARQAEEAAINTCYTTNGCTPPIEGDKGGANDAKRQAKEQCEKDFRSALKPKLQQCVAGKLPGFNLPNQPDHQQERQGEFNKGGRKHDKDDIQKACSSNSAAVATVQACIQSARKSNAPSNPQAQAQARFDSNCKVKAQCDSQLTAQCQSSLDDAEKAVCECGQQLRSDQTIRAGVASCQTVDAPKQRKARQCGQQRDPKKEPGYYCNNGGYAAWQAANPRPQGGDHH